MPSEENINHPPPILAIFSNEKWKIISATFTAVVKAQLDDETSRKCKYYCLDRKEKRYTY